MEESHIPATVFSLIRESCAAVAGAAQFVRIQTDRLGDYASSLPLDRLAAPQLDDSAHYLNEPEGTAAFFVTLDTINFGSGYFPHILKRPSLSGYFTVATALAEHYRACGPIGAERLAGITASDCAALLGQDMANVHAAELMGLFAEALNDLGRLLLDKYGGSFTQLVESADGRAANLIRVVSQMPFYKDVQQYKGQRVAFFKRAQLLAADLALALGGEGLGSFTDLDELTLFADNLVPHVLRVDGVLAYDAELLSRIETGELIAKDSVEEIEIRACAVHAVELIAEASARRGRRVTAMQLDYLLWNRGQDPYYKKTRPRHRTRTVFY
jgi:hypothetical protein